jgi:hypothetical protein
LALRKKAQYVVVFPSCLFPLIVNGIHIIGHVSMVPCVFEHFCRDPNIGLTTKARACKGVSWKWSPWVTLYVLGV